MRFSSSTASVVTPTRILGSTPVIQGFDSMPESCSCHYVADLHIKNIPATLHERLRRYARENNCTMRAVVLSAIERELARRAWRKCLDERPETDLGVEAVTLLMEERKRRDKQLG